MTTREPAKWERQPAESTAAFNAFTRYRDMGPTRTVRRVAQKVDKSLTVIGRWSVRHAWTDRVSAWDSELDRNKQEGAAEEARELGRIQAERLKQQRETLAAPAIELSRRLADHDAPLEGLDIKSLVELVARAAKPLLQVMEGERAAAAMGEERHGSATACRACEEREAAHREAESMSREEIEQYLLGAMPDRTAGR